jgi:hypothetical protein
MAAVRTTPVTKPGENLDVRKSSSGASSLSGDPAAFKASGTAVSESGVMAGSVSDDRAHKLRP